MFNKMPKDAKKRGQERSLLCCKQALIYYNIRLHVGICACQWWPCFCFCLLFFWTLHTFYLEWEVWWCVKTIKYCSRNWHMIMTQILHKNSTQRCKSYLKRQCFIRDGKNPHEYFTDLVILHFFRSWTQVVVVLQVPLGKGYFRRSHQRSNKAATLKAPVERVSALRWFVKPVKLSLDCKLFMWGKKWVNHAGMEIMFPKWMCSVSSLRQTGSCPWNLSSS